MSLQTNLLLYQVMTTPADMRTKQDAVKSSHKRSIRSAKAEGADKKRGKLAVVSTYGVPLESNEETRRDKHCDGWYKVPLASIDRVELDNHKQELTVQLRGKDWMTDEPLRPILPFRETDKYFVVPRYYGISKFEEHVNLLPVGCDLKTTRFEGHLDDARSQVIAHQQVVASLSGPTGSAQLCLPPGGGKTTTALKIICTMKKCAMIFVHTIDLCDQWLERIEQFMPDAKAVHLHSKLPVREMDGVDIAVCTIQSFISWLKRGRNPASPFAHLDRFGMLVFDESHHFSAPEFSMTIPYLIRPLNLALSGTPYRNDGSHELLARHIGPVTFMVRKEYSVPVYVKVMTPILKDDADRLSQKVMFNGKSDRNAMLADICVHQRRNMALARALVHESSSKRMLGLSDRVEHLHVIADLCRTLQPGCDVGVVTGKVKKSLRPELRSKRIVLATFPLYNEGMDDATLGGIVLLTNRPNVYQAICRVMRSRDMAFSPVIVDVKDPSVGMWISMYKKRVELYGRENYTITHVDRDMNAVPEAVTKIKKKRPDLSGHMASKEERCYL